VNLERRLERLERASPEPAAKGPTSLDHEVAALVVALASHEGPRAVARCLLGSDLLRDDATERDAALLAADLLHYVGRDEDAAPLEDFAATAT
jgi:hypothetical protein